MQLMAVIIACTQARERARFTHKVLRMTGGVEPPKEHPLHRSFAVASCIAKGVRNPLLDWAHQYKTMTIAYKSS